MGSNVVTTLEIIKASRGETYASFIDGMAAMMAIQAMVEAIAEEHGANRSKIDNLHESYNSAMQGVMRVFAKTSEVPEAAIVADVISTSMSLIRDFVAKRAQP